MARPNVPSAQCQARDLRGWAIQALALAAALAAVFAISGRAAAQVPQQHCAPRSEIIKHLAGTYRETTIALGVAENGAGVVEVLTSAEGSTWTLLYSLPNGVSCLVATGQDWQSAPARLGPAA